MNDCDDIRELLSASLDGELTEAESHRLTEHLASCEACRRELDALKRVWTGLGALGEVDLPEGLEERVFQRVADVRPRRRRTWLPRWVYPVATAAAILLAFVLGHLLWTNGALDPRTQQIVRDMELLENLEMLENLDEFEKMGDGVILLSAQEPAENSGGGGS